MTHKTSIEKLLAMTSQEFADASTRLKREQEHNNFMKESEIKQRSMQDEIEAHRRQANTGMSEAWRQGGKVSVPTSSGIKDESNVKEISLSENAVTLNENTEIVESDDISGVKRKRSGYTDVGKRLVTKRSSKSVEEDMIEMTEDDMNMMYRENVSHSVDESDKSTAYGKPPSVIDIIQSTAGIDRVQETGAVRLMCNDGSTRFQIAQPGSPHLDCTAAVNDRYECCIMSLRVLK